MEKAEEDDPLDKTALDDAIDGSIEEAIETLFSAKSLKDIFSLTSLTSLAKSFTIDFWKGYFKGASEYIWNNWLK